MSSLANRAHENAAGRSTGREASLSDAPPPPLPDGLGQALWREAGLAAALLAVDPPGLGGASLLAAPGLARKSWIEKFRLLMGEGVPFRTMPANADEDRVIGGLDLSATLSAGRPVLHEGLLAEAHGGVLAAGMAERLVPSVAAAVAAAMDAREVVVERNGVSARRPAAFALLLQDESYGPDEAPPGMLLERIAFRLDLHAISIRDISDFPFSAVDVARARARLDAVTVGDDAAAAVNAAAVALGLAGLRPLGFALRAAKAHAALAGRDEVTGEDAAVACRLVFGASLPQAQDSASQSEEGAEPPPSGDESTSLRDDAPQDDVTGETSPKETHTDNEGETDVMPPSEDSGEDLSAEMLVEAARAAPVALALAERAGRGPRNRRAAAGKAGRLSRSAQGGRPVGSEKRDPRRGGRLDVAATLRTAAPFQKMRVRPDSETQDSAARLRIYPGDLHFRKYEQKTGSSVIFVVDASGSAAMHRLAEAKGAAELLLQDCYVRRDVVGLIAFRGVEAETLLAPTQSLLRARRALAAMPGGGGTPLAAAIMAAAEVALGEREKGRTPLIVFLSDGQANIALDGAPGREAARRDAETAARKLAALEMNVLFFDTSRRPSARVAELCAMMNGRYAALPYADGKIVADTVKQETARPRGS